MAMSSGVVVRHALTHELGWRIWYAGSLVAATVGEVHADGGIAAYTRT